MKISIDFNKCIGKIKAMHAVGQPPIEGISTEHFRYLTNAGIPQSRLHDVAGTYGRWQFVDIPNIFRDFSADENDPASYHFAFTDILIKALIEAGIEPYFRLGVTIENYRMIERYTTYPPTDFEKWARICEHIIRHYNEGWADGFHYNIKYWEIWNEPDDEVDRSKSSMWYGTMEEYFRLYDITSKHLKACFGNSIKVGGYAATGVNQPELDMNLSGITHTAETNDEYRIKFMHGFFKYISERQSPIDFFSYHSYSSISDTVKQVRYYDAILQKYGYGHIERHLNEWSLCWALPGIDCNEKDHLAFSSNTLAMMLAMQHEKVDLLHYYDARMTSSCNGGLFNSETRKPTNTYFSFHMFNKLYTLENEVSCISDVPSIYAIAATNGKRSVLVLANPEPKPVTLDLELAGANEADAEILRIDSIYRYSPTGESLKNGKFTLPAYGCAEIRFY